MSGLTAARHGLAAAIVQAVPDTVTVNAIMPPNAVAPSVSLMAGNADSQTGCLWLTHWTAQLIGPGGDNEAGICALEDMAVDVCRAVVGAFPDASITLQTPAVSPIAGTLYLTQDLDIALLISLEE